MNFNTSIISLKTVPSTYSWDEGVPEQTYLSVVDSVSSLSGNSTLFEAYCPYAKITLFSSLTGVVDSNVLTILRTIDFGDFYNTNTNIVTVEGFNDVSFEHVYYMPGSYNITVTETVFLSSTGAGTYIESPNTESIRDYSWQWKNFLSGNETNALNKEVTWRSSSFQQTNEVAWRKAKYPCIQFNEINFASLQVTKEIKSLSATIILNEIAPVCYLSANQTEIFENRVSPFEVVLTPKYTRQGSFPLYSIVWDLGDNSPLLTKQRDDISSENSFVFSNTLTGDIKDVRNYDVIYTYVKKSEDEYSFYPSITAFAGPTNTFDSASCIIGPLKLPSLSANNFKIIQNSYSTLSKHVLIGQIEDYVGVWKLSSV